LVHQDNQVSLEPTLQHINYQKHKYSVYTWYSKDKEVLLKPNLQGGSK